MSHNLGRGEHCSPVDSHGTRSDADAGKTWTIIVLLSLIGQVAWAVENNFFNLFIQDAFGASLSDVALMVSASALTATATTLLVGVWSDRVGLYQGVRIFTIVFIPMLVGPWIGSTISASSGAIVGFGVVGDGFTPSSLIFAGGAAVALLTFIVLYFIRREERR